MSNFLNTTDYTPVAPFYDGTRNIPEHILKECYQRIIAKGIINPDSKILDAGCGTAQISMVLIKMGYSFTGIDISPAMLEIARSKLQKENKADFIIADVRAMNFPDSYFDVTIVSKLFQHVGNWKSAVDEILRVSKNGGYFIHINEKGAFKNEVRKKFTELCDKYGFSDRYIGIRKREELKVYLRNKGAKTISLDVQDLKWNKTISYGDALNHLKLKLHSEFWCLPDQEYQNILSEVMEWINEQPEGVNTVELMSPFLVVDLFSV